MALESLVADAGRMTEEELIDRINAVEKATAAILDVLYNELAVLQRARNIVDETAIIEEILCIKRSPLPWEKESENDAPLAVAENA